MSPSKSSRPYKRHHASQKALAPTPTTVAVEALMEAGMVAAVAAQHRKRSVCFCSQIIFISFLKLLLFRASVPEPVPVPTPSKANNDTQPQLSASFVERMKYAGANFQNAPAASALPIPVFVKASVPSSSPPLLSSIKPPLTLSQSATTYNPLLPVTVSAASVVNNERRNPTQNSGVSVQLIAKSHNDDSGVFSMDGLSEDATLEATHSNSQQFFRMAHVNAMIPPPPLPLSQPPIFVGFDQTQFSVYSHHPHFVRPHFPSTPYQQPPVVFSHLVHNDPIQRTAGMAIPQHLPQQQPIVVHQGHKHAGVTPDMSPSISPPPPHLGEMSQNLKTLLKINET
ncbi:hypothetical protein BDR26DRAFT_852069 [Obelidium mucronatum]|nr:hypothetical protein BDR26DRAFT_852069 [Obelidium mucronatum]